MELISVDLQYYKEHERVFFQVLDSDEKARALRFKFELLRRNYILSHALLRFFLADYQQTDPAAIIFRYAPFGKPYIDGVHFNMSHSKDMALYAFSTQSEVGVDIEHIKPNLTIDALPLSSLSLQEQEKILKLPLEQQRRAFYQFWTRKEAHSKVLGVGLGRKIDSKGWSFEEPFATSEYVSAAAYRAPFEKTALEHPILKIKAATSIEIPPT